MDSEKLEDALPKVETQAIVGKYRLVEQIGAGTAGVVYRAEDPDIGRAVAVKILKAEHLGSESERGKALKRFSAEIRAIGRLVHPNIVSIFDSGLTSDGLPYLVMQMVQGHGLDTILRVNEKGLPIARCLKILRQLASALDYSHSQNVVHRDVKPSNILVDDQDRVFIVDFSTAFVADELLGHSGQVVGTPQYMAPEVIRGEAVTSAADLYSLGIIAFYLFTGQKPFRDGTIEETLSAILKQSAFTFSEIGCDLGAKLERVLRRALSKNPEDRFSKATEFIEECEKAIANGPSGRVFSQVASDPEKRGADGTALLRAPLREAARRRARARVITLRRTLIAVALLLFAGAFSTSYILFGLPEHFYLRRSLSAQLGIGYSPEDFRIMNDIQIVNALTQSLPESARKLAIAEAMHRSNPQIAAAVCANLEDPRLTVRQAATLALITMPSISPESRDNYLGKKLADPDPLIRILAASELVRFQGKKAKAIIKAQQDVEQDQLIARILEQLQSRL